MTQEKCYSCGGKGTYSQMHGLHGAEDFYKRDGFTEKPSIHNYPCNSCEGTGLKKVMTQNWKQKLGKWADENQWSINEIEHVMDFVESLLKEERNAVLDRAWEYVVKASREEHGSKEDFIKFVNEHE